MVCLALGFIMTGRLDPLLMWGGLITPIIASSVIGYVVIYLISELRKAREELESRVEERNLELLVKNRALESEIEERKQIEKEVRRINDDLDRRVRERTADLKKAYEGVKRADQLKDAFLSSVSHELRTPLTSIRSFAEILLQYDDEAPETRREFAEIIQVESDRLGRLINDFLDLSKIQAGKMVYNDDLVSIEEILQGRDEDPASALPGEVPADESGHRSGSTACLGGPRQDPAGDHESAGQCRQVFFPGGEVRARVEVLEGKRTGERPDWIKVSISDQGIGIEEKHFEMIFDKFRQVSEDTLEDKPSGTGLGLPICKEIVSYYGGNIWVESRKGRGQHLLFYPSESRLLRRPRGRLSQRPRPPPAEKRTPNVRNVMERVQAAFSFALLTIVTWFSYLWHDLLLNESIPSRIECTSERRR